MQDQDTRWWRIALPSVVGFMYVWSMWARGLAELPHLMAALTVLVPMVLFAAILKSPWPAVGALMLLIVIDVSLRW